MSVQENTLPLNHVAARPPAGDGNQKNDANQKGKPRNGPPRRFLVIGAIIVVLGLFFGIRYWMYASTHEDTDDAYVTGYTHQISSRITGTVQEVLVDDNWHVTGGLVGLPGWGIYNSTKFAVEGLSEALAEELAHLGIRVTLVNPGPFRTNFLGGSLTLTERKIDAYAESAGKTRQYAVNNNQRQVGDPARAAHAIIAAVLAEQPPLHLPLGAFAHERASLKLDQLRTEYAVWRDVALAADFPDEKSA